MFAPFVEYERRVSRGLQAIEAWRPGSYRDIDLNMLAISSPNNCMCGQLAQFVKPEERGNVKGWRSVLKALGIENADASDFGFAGCGFYDSYGELTAEWRRQIKAMLALDAELEDLRSEETTIGQREAELALA